MRQTYVVVWSPEGREIARVQARNARHACKLAPKPYRQFQGELYAETVIEYEARIARLTLEPVNPTTQPEVTSV